MEKSEEIGVCVQRNGEIKCKIMTKGELEEIVRKIEREYEEEE